MICTCATGGGNRRQYRRATAPDRILCREDVQDSMDIVRKVGMSSSDSINQAGDLWRSSYELAALRLCVLDIPLESSRRRQITNNENKK